MMMIALFYTLAVAAANSGSGLDCSNFRETEQVFVYLAPSKSSTEACLCCNFDILPHSKALVVSPTELQVLPIGWSLAVSTTMGEKAVMMKKTDSCSPADAQSLSDSQFMVLKIQADASERSDLAKCDSQTISWYRDQSAVYASSGRSSRLSSRSSIQASRAGPTFIPKGTNAAKDQAVQAVGQSSQRYMQILSQLSGATPLPAPFNQTLATRFTGTPDNLMAVNFCANLLKSAGFAVSKVNFTNPEIGTSTNVVGVLQGTEAPEEIVVIGAHIDSRAENDTIGRKNAPGAVDNGSGSAGVLVIAEALKNLSLKRTVHLVLFNGEEQGIYGSKAYVEKAVQQGLKIQAALIMDMIGFSSKYYGVTFEGTTAPDIIKLLNICDANCQAYSTALSRQTSTYSFGSDHVPFQRQGIPAVLFIERDDTDYFAYHSVNDVIANVNASESIDILKALTATALDYILAPTNVPPTAAAAPTAAAPTAASTMVPTSTQQLSSAVGVVASLSLITALNVFAVLVGMAGL
mmetsp:Transcript_5467/g.10430  ORF Transcript_5467/g.10430 Transcript_5467/m.10430 type:complete len:520 (+) Transcript_5467:51-1610(+)